MAVEDGGPPGGVMIEIAPELRTRVERAAAAKGVAIRDYVADVLRQAVGGEEVAESGSEDEGWRGLSAQAFARDWESDEDRVYDDIQ